MDDSAVIRLAISKMLKTDFEVVLAGDGEAGWEEICRNADVSVLITDIEMPRLDGYAFICRVRASDEARIRELPIIVITGADDDETKARAYACGATDFITKPLNMGQLQSCVQAYMRFEQPLAEGMADERDPVSGLPGRRAFLARGAEAAARHERLTVLAIALDHARVLYRQHGDEHMDAFVRATGSAIQSVLPPSTCVARLGGAEFGVLLADVGADEAQNYAQRIVAALKQAPIEGVSLTCSVGLAHRESNRESWDVLMAGADERLKRAVAQGGNQMAASALSDILRGAEEFVLDAVALPTEPEPLAGSDVLGEADLLAEPMPLDDYEQDPPAGAGASAPGLMSLDRALWLLSMGREDVVAAHMDPLMADLIPLLEFIERRRDLGLGGAIGALRETFVRGRDRIF
ncbi:MAG: response regulator [Gammaproteobacteria bacterium]|nr:response regulator [Gammaproteobacteria bacterium]